MLLLWSIFFVPNFAVPFENLLIEFSLKRLLNKYFRKQFEIFVPSEKISRLCSK